MDANVHWIGVDAIDEEVHSTRSRRRTVVGLAGCLAIVFALGFVALESTNLKRFVHQDTVGSVGRFLTMTEPDLSYKGQDLVRHQAGFNDFIDEIFDYKGYKQRVACSEYRGVDHPNARECCAEECGREFCGTDDCFNGPGGAAMCCGSQMPPVFCGPDQMAPCLINATHLAEHFDNHKCLQYDGVDSVDHLACCTSTCGEFCGASFCHKFNPVGSDGLESTECCPQHYLQECGPEVNAPCFFVPATTAGPVVSTRRITTSTSTSSTTSTTTKTTTTSTRTTTTKTTTTTSTTRKTTTLRKTTTDEVPHTTTTTTTTTTRLLPPMLLVYKGFPSDFAPNQDVQLAPHVSNGGRPTRYTVTPQLPKAFSLNASTGVVRGRFGPISKTESVTYTIVGANAAGKATYEFKLPKSLAPTTTTTTMTTTTTTKTTTTTTTLEAPLFLHYKQPDSFVAEEKLVLKPNTGGGRPTRYTIEPNLPAGLTFDQRTGVFRGVIGKPTKSMQTYRITAINAGGRATSKLKLPKFEAAPFPWWIIVVALLVLIAGVLWYLRSKKEVRDPSYRPLPQGQKIEPAVGGFPIVFDTGSGEKTVWATRKPLGLEYAKQLPIRVVEEAEGHGRELGVQNGWIMKSINGKSLVHCRDFPEARTIMQHEVRRLPGGIPLTWITRGNNLNHVSEATVWATKSPLGLNYAKKLPITVSEVKDSGHGKELNIQVGWVLKAVNYRDVYNMTDYGEVHQVLKDEMDNLGSNAYITNQTNGL